MAAPPSPAPSPARRATGTATPASPGDSSAAGSFGGGALSWLTAPFQAVTALVHAVTAISLRELPPPPRTHATAHGRNNSGQPRAEGVHKHPFARAAASASRTPGTVRQGISHSPHALADDSTSSAPASVASSRRNSVQAAESEQAAASSAAHSTSVLLAPLTPARGRQLAATAATHDEAAAIAPVAPSDELLASPLPPLAASKDSAAELASPPSFTGLQSDADRSLSSTPARRPVSHSYSSPFSAASPAATPASSQRNSAPRRSRDADSLEEEEESDFSPGPARQLRFTMAADALPGVTPMSMAKLSSWAPQGLAHAASSPALSAAAAHSPAEAAPSGTALPPAEELRSAYTTAASATETPRPPMHNGQPQLALQPRLQTGDITATAAWNQQARSVSAPDFTEVQVAAAMRSLPSVPDLSSYSSANVEEAEASAAAAASAARAAADIPRRDSTPDLLPQLFGFGRKSAGNADSSQSASSASFAQLPADHPVSPVAPARNVKLLNFQRLLAEPNADLAQLRRLSWSGIPMAVRAGCWKLLLGYLPVALARRPATLQKRRAEYATYLSDFFYLGRTPEEYYAAEARGESVSRTESEHEILKQIKQDVPRTSPGLGFFKAPLVQASLERVLFIFSIRHPASGYVQGINDLVTPFYAAFMFEEFGVDIVRVGGRTREQGGQAGEHQREGSQSESKAAMAAVQDSSALQSLEADCFWCMSHLLDGIQDHYTFAQPGIQRMVFRLEELILRIDGNANTTTKATGSTPKKALSATPGGATAAHVGLHAHLAKEHVQFLHFSFRWMTCLLMRELRLSLILRLWDSYLSESGGVSSGFKQLHVYVCAAFLMRFKDELKSMEFQQIIQFLQKMPTDSWSEADVESLLAQAHIYQTLFQASPQHLA